MVFLQTTSKVGEIRVFQNVERKDYLNERRGSNIVWGEDPGVTYSVKTRVGVEGGKQEMDKNSFGLIKEQMN